MNFVRNEYFSDRLFSDFGHGSDVEHVLLVDCGVRDGGRS